MSIVIAFVFGVTTPSVQAESKQENLDKKLLSAVNKDQYSKFKKLLKKGANPNKIYGKRSKEWVMCAATKKDRLKFLKSALEYGGDINLRNSYTTKSTVKAIYSAPILCSIGFHNDEAFDYLLGEGVDVDIIACTECIHEKFYGSAVTVAEKSNEYRMALELVNRRTTKLTSFELRSLRLGIENTTINEKSEENAWRWKFVDWLRAKGHEVTPWTKTGRCDQDGCKKD